MAEINEHTIVKVADAQDAFGRDIEIFHKLTIRDWVQMIKLCDHQYFPSKNRVLSAGQINKAVYFILYGQVRVEQQEGDRCKVLARLPSGCVFGELSFLDGDTVSADVITEGMVEVLRLDKDDLEDLAKTDQGFGLRFFQSLALTLSRRVRNTNYVVGSSKI
jgi:CRP/FNR family transcriptional regulator, cyclic AMP receptor protein